MKKNNDALGMYLHIPFCLRKCNYCDFCSYPDRDATVRERYVDRLCEELIARSDSVSGRAVDTLYFGGGTPTLLSCAQIEQLMDTVRSHYTLLPDTEITVECNPATANTEKLTALRTLGINRLSIGAQSANDAELASLGRLHRFSDTVATVRAARAAGFDNLSLDLMYGIPHQTKNSFAATLQAILALSPEHLSVYSLIVEPNTPFYDTRDTLPLPDEDSLCDMTDHLLATLRAAGYERYEISNFARDTHVSRHNLHYWRLDDYLGFGPAAHSLLGNVRTGHSRDLDAYLAGEDTTEEEEMLDDAAARDEYLMLRLRLTAGVDKKDFFDRFGVAFDTLYGKRAAPFVRKGLLVDVGDRIFFTDQGFSVSNAVLSELLFLE